MGGVSASSHDLEAAAHATEEMDAHSVLRDGSGVSELIPLHPFPTLNVLDGGLIVMWRTFHSTAGVNLGRLIQILDCPFETDEVYCLWALTILALAEMTGGILVACVPTLGPLLRRRYREKSSKTNLGGPRNHEGRALLTIGSRPRRLGKNNVGTSGEDMLLFPQGNACIADDRVVQPPVVHLQDLRPAY